MRREKLARRHGVTEDGRSWPRVDRRPSAGAFPFTPVIASFSGDRSMVRSTVKIVTMMAIIAASVSVDAQRVKSQKPLVIADQGSFFVGGESKTIGGAAPAQGRGGAPP